jgi:hypothetical protein
VKDTWLGVYLRDICNDHDYEYWLGGDEGERRIADYQLGQKTRQRFRDKGKPWAGRFFGLLRALGVRVLGATHWDYW